MYGYFEPVSNKRYLGPTHRRDVEDLTFASVDEAIAWWKDNRFLYWQLIKAPGDKDVSFEYSQQVKAPGDNDLAAFMHKTTGIVVVVRELEPLP